MVRFGNHVVGYSLVTTLSRSLDRTALGLFYDLKYVGYYQNAVNLYDNSIFSVFAQAHNVGSVTLSKLQSNIFALRQKYEAGLCTMCFFMMPAAAILSVTAQDLVVILLGQTWRPAGALLAILALRGIFQAVEGSNGWLHLSLGRVDRWKNWGLISTVVQVVAVACGLPFGPEGMAVALVVASALTAYPAIGYAGRPAGIGIALALRATGRPLTGALACAGAGWLLQVALLQHVPGLLRILLSSCCSAAVYLVIVVGLLHLTEPLGVVQRLIGSTDLWRNLCRRVAVQAGGGG
jgi:PST family polysaccharide transporter